jgi:cell wall-associated NlpC family hydrolase
MLFTLRLTRCLTILLTACWVMVVAGCASGPQFGRGSGADTVVTAMGFLGVPYRWGGNSADEGFDCSGFTRAVFQTSRGVNLPRRAEQQARMRELVSVRRGALQPGDLVFFNTGPSTYSHVGIYTGDGKFIHAPRSGAEVRIEDLRVGYWASRYSGARRAQS